ncbi:osmoprotectant NAGGN system M42 family peptidase [Meridianimarinicoccus roseus]|jgi:peptidase M42 family hydrolase|uniref:Osmoprotectant NAGGN system M42 family peptidase n=1 Tax=Meridianimarinicoccus roseus TaxID=2072018 RepID=A0A2V2LBD9_9RHOB|nr:osmoprotectant NAGGN system M42 family peptidase [Meridianimarinicoccus roseus]PWR02512.1 osmoprotectant NAGGN system M42 family peptidase [Meridianimarinicoccus roseus]
MSRLEIDIDYLRDQLHDLLTIPSPTGFTDTIVRHVCAELDKLGLDYDLTRRGAIRALLPGRQSAGARAVVSHVDTLGAQVKAIKPNGRLELVPIGTWSARFAEGARTTIFTDRGTYRGTILPMRASGHTYGDGVDDLPVGWEHVEMRIDAYTNHAEMTYRLGIEVGDIIAIDPQPEFLDNGFIVSRHLDNKAGVAVMLAALKAMKATEKPPVDIFWLFTIAEEVGHGAAAVVLPDIASMVAVDNGTSAPGQNSAEFGVTIAMADQTGPFDYHLTRKLVQLCRDNDIRVQKDVFRYYRSDSASAVEAGADVRTALATFGVDASHGYERIHMHALRSLSEMLTCYGLSEVEIPRDRDLLGSLEGFTRQPDEDVLAEQALTPETELAQNARGR